MNLLSQFFPKLQLSFGETSFAVCWTCPVVIFTSICCWDTMIPHKEEVSCCGISFYPVSFLAITSRIMIEACNLMGLLCSSRFHNFISVIWNWISSLKLTLVKSLSLILCSTCLLKITGRCPFQLLRKK